MELKKLKSLLPSLQQKSSSSPMEIVMETIRYIRQLEDQLIDRFQLDVSSSQSSFSDASMNSSLSSSTPLQDIGNSNWTFSYNSFLLSVHTFFKYIPIERQDFCLNYNEKECFFEQSDGYIKIDIWLKVMIVTLLCESYLICDFFSHDHKWDNLLLDVIIKQEERKEITERN